MSGWHNVSDRTKLGIALGVALLDIACLFRFPDYAGFFGLGLLVCAYYIYDKAF